MALKYPNKLKRAGYWHVYERAEINNFLLVFREICEIVPRIAELPHGRGRPPNLTLSELYQICTLAIAFDLTFRELETFVQLLLNKKLAHTNLSRWLSRLDEGVIGEATKKLNRWMTRKRRLEYVVDSTPLTLAFYRTLMHAGNELLELVTWKLHVLLAYLPALGLLSVVAVYTTYGDAHDSPPFREYLLSQAELRHGARIHGDSAYWGIENITQTKERGVIPNFVPREGADGGLVLGRAIKEYDNEARKRFRGMVQGFFGGLASRQGTRCRLFKHQSKVIFGHALALAQQIRTWMRYKVLILASYFRTNPAFFETYKKRRILLLRMAQKTKEKRKIIDNPYVAFVAFMFLGMGIGSFFGQTGPGTLVGMGLGYLVVLYLKK